MANNIPLFILIEGTLIHIDNILRIELFSDKEYQLILKELDNDHLNYSIRITTQQRNAIYNYLYNSNCILFVDP